MSEIPGIAVCLALVACAEPLAQGPGAGLVHAAPVSAERADDQEVFWRSAKSAGANALYLMLWGNGIERGYAEVTAAVAHGSGGATVADLVAAGEQFGLELEALRVTPESARALPVPVVAHLDYGNSDYRHGGRFVLISSWGEGTCVACDAQTGLSELVEEEELLRIWSGVVVARRDAVRGGGALMAVVAVLLGAVVMATLLALRSRLRMAAKTAEAPLPRGAL